MKRTLTETRERAIEVAAEINELRSKPERGDTWAADLRNAVAELQSLDVMEARATAAERREIEQYAWDRAVEAEELRQLNDERSGPAAAFGDFSQTDDSIMGRYVSSPEYRGWVEGGHVGSMPTITLRGSMALERRNLLDVGNSGGASADGFLTVGQPITPTPRQARLFIRDLIPTAPTNLAVVPYVREVSAIEFETANGAKVVAEASAKPEARIVFEDDTAIVRKIAAWVPATEEILSDAPTLQGYVIGRLSYLVRVREDQQILAGTGTNELKGITTFGIQSITGASGVSGDVPRMIASGIGAIEASDGDANGVAMHPLDYWAMIGARHSDRFDTDIAFGGGAGTIWGLPVVRTRTVTSGLPIVADWTAAMVFDRLQTTVRQSDSHSDFFITNKLAILAEERIGLAVFRPDLFAKVTTTAS